MAFVVLSCQARPRQELRRAISEGQGCHSSHKMVENARVSAVYAERSAQGVHVALRRQKAGSLKIVVTSDKFISVGVLDDNFALVARSLRRGNCIGFFH